MKTKFELTNEQAEIIMIAMIKQAFKDIKLYSQRIEKGKLYKAGYKKNKSGKTSVTYYNPCDLLLDTLDFLHTQEYYNNEVIDECFRLYYKGMMKDEV